MTREDGEPCALVPLPTHASATPHTMLYGWPLRALLHQPWDLIHCWEEPYVAAAAQVAAWAPAKVPLVYATFQNIDKRYPPPFSWCERYVADRADGLVVFGQTMRAVARSHGFVPRRTRVIPIGVDTVRFAPNPAARARIRAALGWDDGTPVVGFVGRFVPEKGVELLTEILGARRQPWRAVFVGRGPLDRALRQWAAPYGDRVAIATTVGHDEVPDWLNAMDVLCAPSQSTRRWREQFGRMLIEAFAVGLPVLASDSGEIPYVVGDAGLVLPERDAAAWATTLDALLRDVPRRTALGHDARARAVSTFDWRVVARHHTHFFEQVIDGSINLAASATVQGAVA